MAISKGPEDLTREQLVILVANIRHIVPNGPPNDVGIVGEIRKATNRDEAEECCVRYECIADALTESGL